MQENNFGIREAFSREPEQAGFLVKFTLGGAVAIAVACGVAASIAGPLPAALVALVLALVYGSVLVVATTRLIARAVSRRFVETAMKMRAAGPRGAVIEPDDAQPAAPPAMREQASFNQAYFMLRLQEEVGNARRDGREMSLVAIEATVPGVPMNPELAVKIAQEFARLASDQAKVISHTLSVSESEYVMSLPTSDAGEAKAFVSKVVQALGNYWCHFGVGVYPVHGTTAEALFKQARDGVQESREGKSSPRSHAVA